MPQSDAHLVNHVDVARFWDAVGTMSPTFLADAKTAALAGRASAEYEALSGWLAAVHPGLVLIVGGDNESRLEVIVSADGNRRLFATARAVVDAAPEYIKARFGVRALRPRSVRPEELGITLKGRFVTAADIRWQATPKGRNSGVCDLTLHVSGWIDALPATSPANEPAGQQVFLLLDHLIGEWATETQIDRITFKSTAGSDALPPLTELPEFLDKLSAR